MANLQARNLSTKLVKSCSSHCLGAHIPHCKGNAWKNRKEKSYITETRPFKNVDRENVNK